MVEEKSWEEFRESGLLWLINTTLHVFGWAIVFEIYKIGDDTNIRVYPARVKFRGFNEKVNTNGYRKVTEYLENNVVELGKEAKEME